MKKIANVALQLHLEVTAKVMLDPIISRASLRRDLIPCFGQIWVRLSSAENQLDPRIWQKGGAPLAKGGGPPFNLRGQSHFKLLKILCQYFWSWKNPNPQPKCPNLEVKILVNSCKKRVRLLLAEIWRNLGINFSDKKACDCYWQKSLNSRSVSKWCPWWGGLLHPTVVSQLTHPWVRVN